MPKYVAKRRLEQAVERLAAIRASVNPQGLQHLLPFLALKRKGVSETGWIQFEEQDDFDFWDRFFLVDAGSAAGKYYDPFAGQRRISSHPHSNVATARKGTFARWGAVAMREEHGRTEWKLEPHYLAVLQAKVLTKAGDQQKVPVIDLIAWLRRLDPLPDDASLESLVAAFISEFRLAKNEFDALFIAGDQTEAGSGTPE